VIHCLQISTPSSASLSIVTSLAAIAALCGHEPREVARSRANLVASFPAWHLMSSALEGHSRRGRTPIPLPGCGDRFRVHHPHNGSVCKPGRCRIWTLLVVASTTAGASSTARRLSLSMPATIGPASSKRSGGRVLSPGYASTPAVEQPSKIVEAARKPCLGAIWRLPVRFAGSSTKRGGFETLSSTKADAPSRTSWTTHTSPQSAPAFPGQLPALCSPSSLQHRQQLISP